jgi:hypothetical protein
MRAPEIADAVEAALRRIHGRRRPVYRREWSIGVGSVRVDVAAINGEITGCEIKSTRDNFARLHRQAEAYSRVVDNAVLAIASTASGRGGSTIPTGPSSASPPSRSACDRVAVRAVG